MPYTMKTEGMEEISKMLTELGNKAQGVASLGLYDGAAVMREEIEKSARSIRTAPFQYAPPGQTRLPSPEEKEIIVNAGVGIARFDKNGSEVDTSVGYSAQGYAPLKNKLKPVPLIANAINSGTSFMRKQAFVRKAAKSGGSKASDAIREKIETLVEEMTNK